MTDWIAHLEYREPNGRIVWTGEPIDAGMNPLQGAHDHASSGLELWIVAGNAGPFTDGIGLEMPDGTAAIAWRMAPKLSGWLEVRRTGGDDLGKRKVPLHREFSPQEIVDDPAAFVPILAGHAARWCALARSIQYDVRIESAEFDYGPRPQATMQTRSPATWLRDFEMEFEAQLRTAPILVTVRTPEPSSVRFVVTGGADSDAFTLAMSTIEVTNPALSMTAHEVATLRQRLASDPVVLGMLTDPEFRVPAELVLEADASEILARRVYELAVVDIVASRNVAGQRVVATYDVVGERAWLPPGRTIPPSGGSPGTSGGVRQQYGSGGTMMGNETADEVRSKVVWRTSVSLVASGGEFIYGREFTNEADYPQDMLETWQHSAEGSHRVLRLSGYLRGSAGGGTEPFVTVSLGEPDMSSLLTVRRQGNELPDVVPIGESFAANVEPGEFPEWIHEQIAKIPKVRALVTSAVAAALAESAGSAPSHARRDWVAELAARPRDDSKRPVPSGGSEGSQDKLVFYKQPEPAEPDPNGTTQPLRPPSSHRPLPK